MKRVPLPALGLLLAFAAAPTYAQIQITDTTHYDTASQMLLANEINDSGEPYAEAIGYDLDLLDPTQPNFPDRTAYVLGIENYEYSRYQLGVVVARSGIGLHMMWSPVIMAMAAMETDPDFDGSMTGAPNGYNEDDELVKTVMHFGHLANQMPPMNPWPQFGEFVAADPHYAQAVDADGFMMDFATLRWDRGAMTKQLSPGAMGQSLMKQYLWAQDMLGGFHDENEDEVVPDGITSPDGPDGMFDPDNGVYYGGDNLDGFVGQVLTAEAINKVKNLLENLAYDGTSLGGVDPMTYDPNNGIRYFPHLIGVNEEPVPGLPPRAGAYEVVDANSELFDQASLLWGTLNFKNMMDPDNSSDEAHLAYHSVFDGDPFPADMGATGMPGPFDLMKGASKVLFLNLMAMHYNPQSGSFVDRSSLVGQSQVHQGNRISALGAAYTLVALGVFQEEFAGTPLAPMALDAIRSQADYLMENLGDEDLYYSDHASVHGSGQGKHGPRTLEGQAAAVRGLYAAYSATGETVYLDAADAAYAALLDGYHDPDSSAFITRLHQPVATYDPLVVAVLAGALREARLVGGHLEATSIYVEFWDAVVNPMQMAEGMATGEMGGDSDGDGIPYIPEQPDGIAPIFAPQATLRVIPPSTRANMPMVSASMGDQLAPVLHQNDPNPFNPMTVIRFDLARPGRVDLAVYDLRGRRVSTLVDANLPAGTHDATFRGENAASGVYYYVLQTNQGQAVGKMTLVK